MERRLSQQLAFVVTGICGPLGSQEIEFLHNVDSADGSDREAIEIDPLVGDDKMWRLFARNVKRNEDKGGGGGLIASEDKGGLVASETSLGWFIWCTLCRG